MRPDEVEHLGGQAAGDAHLLDVLGSFQIDGHAGHYRSFAAFLNAPLRTDGFSAPGRDSAAFTNDNRDNR